MDEMVESFGPEQEPEYEDEFDDIDIPLEAVFPR